MKADGRAASDGAPFVARGSGDFTTTALVPDPGACALMLAGLRAVGIAVRRRRR